MLWFWSDGIHNELKKWGSFNKKYFSLDILCQSCYIRLSIIAYNLLFSAELPLSSAGGEKRLVIIAA